MSFPGALFICSHVKTSFSQRLLVDGLLQRFLCLIQLRGLALRCLRIVKTLFSFLIHSFHKNGTTCFAYFIGLKLFKDKGIFFKNVYFLVLITILSYSWNSHSRFEALNPCIYHAYPAFASCINTCSLPPGTRCKHTAPPRSQRSSANLGTCFWKNKTKGSTR